MRSGGADDDAVPISASAIPRCPDDRRPLPSCAMTGMHADELVVDAETVRRLVAAQFPEWAALPVRRLPPAGTDNQLFRLGDDLLASKKDTGKLPENDAVLAALRAQL